MNFKAVIFDLDGTLLDTLEDIARSMNRVLTSAEFPPHPIDAYRGFIGEGLSTLVRRALPEDHRDENTVLQGVTAMLSEYGRCWSEHTRPYPGIPELLDALTEKKIRMAVLSNKVHTFTRQMVSTLLGTWQFDYVLGAQPSIPQKPDPAGALLISHELGINPEDFIYLGDSSIDMRTAVSTDMYPVGALWGFQTADEILAAGAQKLIRRPLELLAILDGH